MKREEIIRIIEKICKDYPDDPNIKTGIETILAIEGIDQTEKMIMQTEKMIMWTARMAVVTGIMAAATFILAYLTYLRNP